MDKKHKLSLRLLASKSTPMVRTWIELNQKRESSYQGSREEFKLITDTINGLEKLFPEVQEYKTIHNSVNKVSGGFSENKSVDPYEFEH